MIPVSRVMFAGMTRCGLIRECHSATTSCLQTLTGPISIMRPPFAQLPLVRYAVLLRVEPEIERVHLNIDSRITELTKAGKGCFE